MKDRALQRQNFSGKTLKEEQKLPSLAAFHGKNT